MNEMGADHHACVHGRERNEPVRRELDEAVDEARRGTGLSRRSILAGLGAVTGTGLVSAVTPAWAGTSGAGHHGRDQHNPPGQQGRGALSSGPSHGLKPSELERGMHLVLLGTRAGPPAMPDRTGIASAVVVDGNTYVIDCGRSAVTQFLHAGLKLNRIKAVLLTHLHADHIADYYNFFLTGAHIPNQYGDRISTPVKILGPGSAGGLPPKYGGGTAPTIAPHAPVPGTVATTQRLHEAYAYSSNVFLRDMSLPDVRTIMNVSEIEVPNTQASFRNTAPRMRPWEIYRDNKVRITATLVPHGPIFPAFAFRVESDYGSVTFSGDTKYSENLIELAQDTNILVHECLNVEDSPMSETDLAHMREGHIFLDEAGPIAAQSHAGRLVLSHISDLGSPVIDQKKWVRAARVGYAGPVHVGNDLEAYRVGAK